MDGLTWDVVGGRGARRRAGECVAAHAAVTSGAATAAERSSSPDDDGASLVGGASRFAEVNGVRLHYVEAGAGPGRPLVVLLHGFPNFWLLWRRQIPPLVAAGLHVVAPDLRGYNLSDRPRGVRRYAVSEVAADVAALVGVVGAGRRATIVGHDWGGVVAWRLARRHADAVAGTVVLNAPHPAVFARELRTFDQLRRSWYAGFFQLPWLPELALRAGDFAAVERVLRRGPARPGAFTDDDVRRHKAALARPGALRAMVNYYRAALRGVRRELSSSPVRDIAAGPVLVLWGDRDRYLRRQNVEGLDRWVPNVRVRHFPNATHWLPVDEPGAVSEEIASFAAAG